MTLCIRLPSRGHATGLENIADEELKAGGLNVFVAPAAESLDDVFNQIDQLAVLTGAFDGAETVDCPRLVEMRIASVVATVNE